MSNIDDILEEIRKNHIDLEAGVSFYYADRNKKKPVKCKILSVELGYPSVITAQREDTGDEFICYDGYGCYPLDNYDDAYKDSQIQEDRIIY